MDAIQVQTQPLQTEEQVRSANRSRLYRLFSESLRYPQEGLCEGLRDGSFSRSVEELLAFLPYPAENLCEQARGLDLPRDLLGQEIEVEFVRLFEAGIGSPPCPLVEGVYDRDRRAVLKELILFYNHFGLSYAEGSQAERPDHLGLELEFLHYLTFKEVLAMQSGKDVRGYRRAQTDFLARHPLSWTGKLVEKVERISSNLPEDCSWEVVLFYVRLLRLLRGFLEADYRYLEALAQN